LLAGSGKRVATESKAASASAAEGSGSEPDEEKGDLGSSGSMVEADRASHVSGSSSIVVVNKEG
jgi:hypothetical protein